MMQINETELDKKINRNDQTEIIEGDTQDNIDRISEVIVFRPHDERWYHALNNPELWNFLGVKIKLTFTTSIVKNKNDSKTFILHCHEDSMSILYSIGNKNCLLPRIDLFERFASKKKFARFVQNYGLQQFAPITYNQNSIIYPCICKSDFMSNGRGIKLLENPEATIFGDRIYQEYIPGAIEYVSHIVCDKGQIIKCITYEYIMESDIIRTSKSKLTTERIESNFIEIFELFLIDYTGVCNIDYKIQNSTVKVMEINPRLGGSLMKRHSDLLEIVATILELYQRNRNCEINKFNSK